MLQRAARTPHVLARCKDTALAKRARHRVTLDSCPPSDGLVWPDNSAARARGASARNLEHARPAIAQAVEQDQHVKVLRSLVQHRSPRCTDQKAGERSVKAPYPKILLAISRCNARVVHIQVIGMPDVSTSINHVSGFWRLESVR